MEKNVDTVTSTDAPNENERIESQENTAKRAMVKRKLETSDSDIEEGKVEEKGIPSLTNTSGPSIPLKKRKQDTGVVKMKTCYYKPTMNTTGNADASTSSIETSTDSSKSEGSVVGCTFMGKRKFKGDTSDGSSAEKKIKEEKEEEGKSLGIDTPGSSTDVAIKTEKKDIKDERSDKPQQNTTAERKPDDNNSDPRKKITSHHSSSTPGSSEINIKIPIKKRKRDGGVPKMRTSHYQPTTDTLESADSDTSSIQISSDTSESEESLVDLTLPSNDEDGQHLESEKSIRNNWYIDENCLIDIMEKWHTLWFPNDLEDLPIECWTKILTELKPDFEEKYVNIYCSTLREKWSDMCRKHQQYIKFGSSADELIRYPYLKRLNFIYSEDDENSDTTQPNVSNKEESGADTASKSDQNYGRTMPELLQEVLMTIKNYINKTSKDEINFQFEFYKVLLQNLKEFTNHQYLDFQEQIMKVIKGIRGDAYTVTSSPLPKSETTSLNPHT